MEEAYIYLQQLLMYGSGAVDTVLGHIKNPKELFDMSERDLLSVGMTKGQAERAGDRAKRETEKIIKQCKKDNIKVVTIGDPRYPQLLRETDAPPAVLYYKGEWVDFDREYTVGIVGPRNISEYGAKAAFSLAARLAVGGAVILSGGALGGDTYAHSGALFAPAGRTVAVTGGGLSSNYLKTNAPLRDRIIRSGGLLISEFAPDYTPRGSFSFSIRNRVLAGLCHSVVIVEAGEKSGTLITAHHAVDMGREVFSMPGSPTAPQYVGTNRLISEGARLLLSADEVLSEGLSVESAALSPERMSALSAEQIKDAYLNCLKYELQKGKTGAKPHDDSRMPFGKKCLFRKSGKKPYALLNDERRKHTYITADIEKSDGGEGFRKTKSKVDLFEKESALKKSAAKNTLRGNELLVYDAFGEGEYLTDELVERTNLSTSAVLSALTMLEIKGFVKALPGSRYRLS